MARRMIQPAPLLIISLISILMVVFAFPTTTLHSDSPITEFSLPTADSQPNDIVTGPDYNLWLTESKGNNIGRMTRKGVVTEYPIPTAESEPNSIIVGPDGMLWFTEMEGNKIGRITMKGVITEFLVPTAKSQPTGLAAGPDGNLWFTESNSSKIGRITTKGVITEFPVPTANSYPNDLKLGPDHNLWFTETDASQIGMITTKGTVTEFPVPGYPSPWGLAAGPDGNIWFTSYYSNSIMRITTKGVVTEFPLETQENWANVITSGLDGNLWFTEFTGNKIGRISTKGIITEFPVPTDDSQPASIITGPDGNLWFTEYNGNKIGRIVRSAQPTTPTPTRTTSGSPCIGVQPAANTKIQPGGEKKWTAPAQVIDVTHQYCAIFTTNNGRMVAELYPDVAPINVNNFVFLAENGFYDNITWHRVIKDFMAQSGDPTGTGTGDPGYRNIPLEVSDSLKYDREGRLAIARAYDPNSAGGQFFITFAPEAYLNSQYTIIGQVVEGLSVLHQIKIRDVDENPNLPKGDPLVSVRIVDLGVSTTQSAATAAATPLK